MSSSNCCFLICIQISQEADQVVWYSHLFKSFQVCCGPHKGFDVVNKAEVDVFLELSCFFNDPTDAGTATRALNIHSLDRTLIKQSKVHYYLIKIFIGSLIGLLVAP